jgi:SAM-dependent methyltransferase
MGSLVARLERERQHAHEILASEERNWNWHTPAGRIRFERRVKFLSEALPADVRGSAAVIEVGAGTGTYSGRLGESYARLISTDISPDLLQRASERCPNVRFEVMDAHELNVADSSLDAVVGCSILHHLEWGRAVKDYYRALKPGGVIRFSEPNLLNPQIFLQKSIPIFKRWAGDSPDEYAFSRFEIAGILRSAGFSRVNVVPFEFLHPAIPERWIDFLVKVEKWLERTAFREIGGSILIEALK